MSSIKQLTQQISALSQELVASKHELSNWTLDGDEPVKPDAYEELVDRVDDLEGRILDLEEELDDLVNSQYGDDDEFQ